MVMASSAIDRRALRSALPEIDEIELLGTTASAQLVKTRIEQGDLDALLLDDSPSGRQFLKETKTQLKEDNIKLVGFNVSDTARNIVNKVLQELSLSSSRYSSEPSEPQRVPKSLPQPDTSLYQPSYKSLSETRRSQTTINCIPEVIAVGSSTGGPDALDDLIPNLPTSFSPAVLVTQHMPAAFIPILAKRLDRHSKLDVRQAVDGDKLYPGLVLLAPGDYHMEVSEDELTVRLHQGPPEHSCRPSVDVLFRSVAKVFGRRSTGVVLTGMGRDGVDGARAMRGSGAQVLIQDEETSVVWGMPGIIAREGFATFTGSIPAITQKLITLARQPNTYDLPLMSNGFENNAPLPREETKPVTSKEFLDRNSSKPSSDDNSSLNTTTTTADNLDQTTRDK